MIEARDCRACGHTLPIDQFPVVGRWRRRVCSTCRRTRTTPPPVVSIQRTDKVTADGRPVLRRSEVEGLIACATYSSSESADAAFGGAVHDGIARYILACQAHRESTRYADIDEIAREAYLGVARGADPNRYPEAHRLLQVFAETHTAELDTLVGVETTLTADMGWALFTGTLDRLDRTDGGDADDEPTELRITDYKTSWATSSLKIDRDTHEVEDHSFQMRFYAAMCCHRWPSVREVIARVDYIRHGGRGEVDVVYLRDDLLLWMAQVSEAARARWTMRHRRPTGGAGCQYCAHRLSCPESVLPWSGAPSTEEEAEKAFDVLMRMEASVKEARAGLRQWFSRRDPVEWNGLDVGFMTNLTPSWKATDPLGIVTELDARGLKGSEALFTAIDHDKVPSYLHDELVEAGVARWDEGKREFKIRKARAPKRVKVVA